MKLTKRSICLMAVLLTLVLCFAACGEGETTPTDLIVNTSSVPAVSQPVPEPDESVVSEATPSQSQSIDKAQLTKSDAKRVSDCLKAAMEATDVATIRSCLTAGSQSKAQSLVDYYPNQTYTVTVKKVGSYQNYHLYSYTAKGNGGQTEESVALIQIDSNDCLLCVEDAVSQQFRTERKCATCGGTGSVSVGSSACGICGGTGQQYIPNVYFDAALNTWQGQWQACGGCGGAGRNGSVTSPCGGCGGYGFHMN